jgi:hypothetical protein
VYIIQQAASGLTITIQSLSYNNPEQKITIDYPPDWSVCCEKNSPEQYAPARLFSVMFISPSVEDGKLLWINDSMSASIDIDRLNPATITLQEHEKKQGDILSGMSPDIKNVVASSTTLAGNPAYRLDYMNNIEFEKVIRVNTIKDGKYMKCGFLVSLIL